MSPDRGGFATGLLLFMAAGSWGCAAAGAPPAGGVRLSDPFLREVAPFAVAGGTGEPYRHPFLGGLDVPRPQLADVDGDGDADLFVQERTGELMFFENTGTAAEPSFVWRTDQWLDLPVGEWSRFYDMDADGDLDLLAESPFSYIRYFRNDGTATNPRFVLAADTLRDPSGKAIFSDRQNIPNLTDVDCDGRVDLFLGRVDGTVARYEERSLSDEGVPVFDLVTERFEDIEIVAAIAVPGGVGPGGTALHGANSMAFADLDDDGDQDFFWGDFFEPGLLWIENLGTCEQPDLRGTPRPVPAEELIATSGYNAAALRDMDADGDLDLLLGVLGGAFNPNTTASDNLVYYERLPTGLFARRTGRYLDGIDVGSESYPTFGDLDGDGDLDLLVGSKLDPRTLSRARLYHFENTGTATEPAYALRDTLDVADSYHLAPHLADLDADGDLDLVLGTWNQGINVLVNQGSPTAPDFAPLDESNQLRLPRGSHATPALGDLDGDGDLDLLVGESSGEVNFFRNVGSAESASWELVTERVSELDVGRRSAPILVDLDGDGDLDLVVGGESEGAAVFMNQGSVRVPDFVEAGSFPVRLPGYATPVLVDLDGDGDLDLVSGGMGGGLVFFRNTRGR